MTRQWPLPERPWLMTQTWYDLLFAHWPVDPAAVAPLLPPGLQLDTYKGRAWIGVVPFGMTSVTLRGILPLPGAYRFPEINVRTYVTAEGKPGVWFFSLDATSWAAVTGARLLFHLPYYSAAIRLQRQGETVCYTSQRTDGGGRPALFQGRYRPTGALFQAAPGSLEHWLTERYCLYSADRRGRCYRGEIDHAPWPLQAAEAEIEANTMAEATGIALPAVPPLCHFAARIDVHVWPLSACTATS